jgi:hypothetical protein
MTHMSLSSRREYLSRIKPAYLKADAAKKSETLDECCRVTGLSRKHAIVLLAAATDLAHRRARQRKARRPTYGNDVVCALKKVWEILDYPCGQRLAPMLPEVVPRLRALGELSVSDAAAALLVRMGHATCDARLARFRAEARRRVQTTTKPGSLLKSQIPIRTSSWDERRLGSAELDTVAHCGASADGEFAFTLDLAEILTGWCEQETLMGKSQAAIVAALERIAARLPFGLVAIDPDNGSEFINWQLFRWCAERKVEFTRGRPYMKNDNAHVEQKNWTNVRKVFGYARVGRQEIVDLMNDLNRNELRLYRNFFQPTIKLVGKERAGAHREKIRRRYDVAATPYRRVLASGQATPESVRALTATYESLNPAELRRSIIRKLDIIAKLTAADRKKPGAAG